MTRGWKVGPLLLLLAHCRAEQDGSLARSRYDELPPGDGFTYEQQLTPEDSGASGHFGRTLACTREWLAVGAPGTTENVDSVVIFARGESEWDRFTTLMPPTGASDDFGASLAMSGEDLFVSDGDTVFGYHFEGGTWVAIAPSPELQAVGKPTLVATTERLVVAEDGSCDSIQVYHKEGAAWSLETTIEPAPPLERSGARPALSLEGSLLAVGADLDRTQGLGVGRVVVYDLETRRAVDVWPPSATLDGRFGSSVLLYDQRLFVADWRSETSLEAPSVFVFEPTNDGEAWGTTGQISWAGAVGVDQFGQALAANGSGLVASAPGAEGDGMVLLFDLGSPDYAELDRASYPAASGFVDSGFGAALAFCGSALVVGAKWHQTVHSLRIGLPDGSSCDHAGECRSGYCVDGVCCAGSCAEPCYACTAALKGGGVDGRCEPVAAGLDSEDDCADDSGEPCGQTGVCDGAGSCAVQPLGVVCEPPECLDEGTAQGASRCDGMGACVREPPQSCPEGLVCTNGVCLTRCGTDADCRSGYWCSAERCFLQLDLGQECDHPAACKSGYCVDELCCDSACGDGCGRCSAVGNCSPLEAGTPSTACGSLVCNGQSTACPGSCETDDDCREDYFCATSGLCVARRSRGESCAPENCRHSGCSLCAGGGCVDGFCCLLSDAHPCRSLGDACDSADDCASDHCADGVCCQTECTGQCESCDEADSLGECVPIEGQPHGDRAPCWSAGADTPCAARRCDGTARLECLEYVGADVVCRQDSCSDDRQTLEAACDGQGQCAPEETVQCVPYRCGPEARCEATCEVDAQCSPGNHCVAGECVSGTTCRDDQTMIDVEGFLRACAPYQCQDSACRTDCRQTTDCQEGHICQPEAHTCTKLPDHGAPASCAIAAPRGRPRSVRVWVWCLVAWCAWRRRALTSRKRGAHTQGVAHDETH